MEESIDNKEKEKMDEGSIKQSSTTALDKQMPLSFSPTDVPTTPPSKYPEEKDLIEGTAHISKNMANFFLSGQQNSPFTDMPLSSFIEWKDKRTFHEYKTLEDILNHMYTEGQEASESAQKVKERMVFLYTAQKTSWSAAQTAFGMSNTGSIPGFNEHLSRAQELYNKEQRNRKEKAETRKELNQLVKTLASALEKLSSSTSSGRRQPVSCTHCHKQGHTVDRCWALTGRPNRTKPKTRDIPDTYTTPIYKPDKGGGGDKRV